MDNSPDEKSTDSTGRQLCQICSRVPPNEVDATKDLDLCRSRTESSKSVREVRVTIQIPLCTRCKQLTRLPSRVCGAVCLVGLSSWYAAMYFGLATTELIEGAGPSQLLIPALLFGLLWMGLTVASAACLPYFGTKSVYEVMQLPLVVKTAESQGLYVDPKTYLFWGA